MSLPLHIHPQENTVLPPAEMYYAAVRPTGKLYPAAAFVQSLITDRQSFLMSCLSRIMTYLQDAAPDVYRCVSEKSSPLLMARFSPFTS